MPPRSLLSRTTAAAPPAFALSLAVAVPQAAAEGPAAQGEAAPCDAWTVEYAANANLRLTDTPFGQGDGVYPVGPGRLVLRFERTAGERDERVFLVAYEMQERFTVSAKALFFSTTVTNDLRATATPDACGVIAEGSRVGQTVRWKSKVLGYHTDGSVTCDGSLCGTFGAPPSGKSELHIGPGAVAFLPFELGRDGRTFTMASTFVSKTESPKQAAYVALAAREVKRTCATTPRTCS